MITVKFFIRQESFKFFKNGQTVSIYYPKQKDYDLLEIEAGIDEIEFGEYNPQEKYVQQANPPGMHRS